MSGPPPPRGGAGIVFRKELLEVLRDRRALFAAFLLPLLLYPLLFLWMGSAASFRDGTKPGSVGLSGDVEKLRPLLGQFQLEAGPENAGEADLREGKVALLVRIDQDQALVEWSATSVHSAGALKRMRGALDEYRNLLIREKLAARGEQVDPSSIARVTFEDISDARERAASKLGRILPFLLVLIMITGGSFAAIDVVAGEKERGTLETLFVQPLDRMQVIHGKLLVVLTMSFAALAANFLGLLLSVVLAGALGKPTPVLGIDLASLPPPATLVGVGFLSIPLVLLTSALLIAVSAYSRSFREAQTYLLPLTLLTLPFLLLSVAPQATLASAVAIVPLANLGLAMRELLEGRLQPWPLAVAWGSSLLYAGWALHQARALILREDLAFGVEAPAGRGLASESWRRRLLVQAGVYLVGLYLGASWLQAQSLVWGLAATLWGLVLLPALFHPLFIGAEWGQTLGLRPARARSFPGAILAAVGLVVLNTAYKSIQDQILPVPLRLEEIYRELLLSQDMSPAAALFLFAVSPAICEELLWRGAFQGELRLSGKPLQTAALVGLFFGLFHFSIHRLVPTALVGLVLALLRERSGSIWPCVILHGTYNALLLFALEPGLRLLEQNGLGGLLAHPLSGLAAVGLVVGAVALAGAPRERGALPR